MEAARLPSPSVPTAAYPIPIPTFPDRAALEGSPRLSGRRSGVKYELLPCPLGLGCSLCREVSLGPKTLPLGVVQRLRPRAGWGPCEGRKAPHHPTHHTLYPPASLSLRRGGGQVDLQGFLHRERGIAPRCTAPRNIKTSGGLELVNTFLKEWGTWRFPGSK